MTKVIVLNYVTNGLTIVTISDKLISHYDGDITECLLENADCFIDVNCDFLELDIDKFGNFEVDEEVLDTIKQ